MQIELDIFVDKPFWIWDQAEHNKQFRLTNCHCCTNHLLGLPEKNNKPYPIFPFQKQIYDAIENNSSIWILKSRGIGITTFLIRYLAYKILVNDDLAGKTIFIVSGTREQHSNWIKQQIENLFVNNFANVQFNSKYTELTIKSTWIKCMPSRSVKDLRGYTDVAYVFCDESDYFETSVNEELMYSIRPYQEKSKAKVILVSTANRPDGLMATLEKQEPNKWKRLRLDYSFGVGTIYDKTELDKLRQSIEWPREYELQWLGKVGNVVLPSEVDNCIRLGKLYESEPIGQQTLLSCGIDWGFSSSATGIVLLERIRPIDQATNQIQDIIIVRHSELIEKGNVNTICDNLFDLYRKQHNTWYICDGSNRAATNLLKIKFGESLEWDPNDVNPDNMKVVPVNFGTQHKNLLSHMQSIISNGYLAIPEQGNEQLLTALRTAHAKELSLDKTQSVYNDLTDACRLALRAYNIK